MKELISAVSAQTNSPASQVRKVATAILDQFVQLIETQGKFTSAKIIITGTTTPSKPATEEKPERPERKLARMRIRTKKSAKASEVNN